MGNWGAYTLDPIAKNSDDEQRINKAWKEAKLFEKEKKKQQKSKRPSVQKTPFLGNKSPVSHLCLRIPLRGLP